MINGVHGDAAVVRTTTEPTAATSFAQLGVLVLAVGHLTHRSAALEMHFAYLAGRQFDLRVLTVFGHEDGRDTSRAHQLSTFAHAELDVVDGGAAGDGPQRQAVAGTDVGFGAGDHLVTLGQAVGSQDVRLLAVCVVQKSEARGAVGIVLDLGNNSGNTDLVALEIDQTVAALVSTPAEARGDAPLVVTTSGFGKAFEQALLWLSGGELSKVRTSSSAATGRRGLVGSNCHVIIPRSRPWQLRRRTRCCSLRPGSRSPSSSWGACILGGPVA